uniref:beta-mannosidase n=1 Tax=Timema bartmani TaxID=61472 RepID=A0A7R9I7E9_9NEOP|nr:unnamed protein product [Timema bartmani]
MPSRAEPCRAMPSHAELRWPFIVGPSFRITSGDNLRAVSGCCNRSRMGYSNYWVIEGRILSRTVTSLGVSRILLGWFISPRGAQENCVVMFVWVLSVWVLGASTCVGAYTHYYTHSLSLDQVWTVNNTARGIEVPATVPGGIYSDLQDSGVLGDILYRFNDEEYRWVGYENWTYTKRFNVTDDILEKKDAYLVFHGLDTVTDIFLNGELLGSTDNMFIRYQFPVTDLLKSTENVLRVDFYSPVWAARVRYEAQAKDYPILPTCVDPSYRGECHVNHLRKMQSSFAWDWGPAFPSVGLWKSVEIIAYDVAYLRDVVLTYNSDQELLYWDTLLETGSTAVGTVEGVLTVAFGFNTTRTVSTTYNITLDLSEGRNHHRNVSLEIGGDIEWWFPNGLGNQKLYNLSMVFTGAGRERNEITFFYGFHNHELVEDPVDPDNPSLGRTFYIRTNGLDFFQKGANWIPSHILPERASNATTVRRLLEAARDANMNILRVWGGGIYESEDFYEIADQLGILIWQDLMFACSMYPSDEHFLSSVNTEVEQQVRRLQRHPSVAIWAGNNENEAALSQNWYGTSDRLQTYQRDYLSLYVDTLWPAVRATDPTRTYIFSSPSNGVLETIAEGYISGNTGNVLYGDVHYYNYDIDGWDSNQYLTVRYSSEYGIQSFPSMLSLEEVSESSDWSLGSNFSIHRQHHPLGNEQILQQIQRNIPFTLDSSSRDNFETFIFLSQINQAMSIKTESEHYRRGRGVFTSDGQGRTMGAMYWQLNDVWQAPSWASIEFDGRWKMLHYYAKNFFAPFLISPYISPAGNLEVESRSSHVRPTIVLLSDIVPDTSIHTVSRVTVYRWSSLEPVFLEYNATTLNGSGAFLIRSENLDNFLSTAAGDCTRQTCFLHLSLDSVLDTTQAQVNHTDLSLDSVLDTTQAQVNHTDLSLDSVLDTAQAQLGPDNFLFLSPLTTAQGLQVVQVEVVSVTNQEYNLLTVQLTTDNIALFVWLEVAGIQGQFSDNGFHMVTPYKNITFRGERAVASNDLLAAITITTLNSKIVN